VTDDGDLTFGLVAISEGFTEPPLQIEPGQIFEISEQQAGFARDLAVLVSQAKGAALLIDYGRAQPESGDTLQALKRHQKVGPLDEPGEADLTQWADYPLVLEAAVRSGADVTGTITQSRFLGSLGIEHRAANLARARPEAEDIILRQFHRLTSHDQMGELFKVAAIFSPRSLVVPGFEA